MKNGEEEALLRRLKAVEGRIAEDVFIRLGLWPWHFDALKTLMTSLEESEKPNQRCLEVTRKLFGRWRARVATDLAAAQAGLDCLRLELERAGHHEDAAHARLAIRKIGRARLAEQVPAAFLEELDGLHEHLLGTLMFSGRAPGSLDVMPMQVHQDDGRWVIARNFQQVDTGGIAGPRSQSANRVREIYDCWTGERWWGQRYSAKTFATREEAQKYLDDNRERLEQAL
jgi:hypothetical protein